MLLNEILNTRADVKWKHVVQGSEGYFTFDGAPYEIQLHEYDLHFKSSNKTYSLIDFGFTSNQKHAMTNIGQSAKILGIIFNSFVPKIREMNPELILFGISNRNGAMLSRESLYSRLADLFSRGSSYQTTHGWFETSNGKYKLLDRILLSREELLELEDIIKLIPLKD